MALSFRLALANQIISTVTLPASEISSVVNRLESVVPANYQIININTITKNCSHHLLLGYISSDCHGNLKLQDDSGTITCKFLNVPLECMGCLILVTNWIYCYHEFQSYIEITAYDILQSCPQHAVQNNKIIKLAQIKSCPKPHTALTVEAIVSAVSPVMRRGHEDLCLIQLQDGPLHYLLVVKDSSLLYLSELIHLYKTYIFTDLCDSIMNKGHPQLEARVLSTTPHTKVYLSPTPIPAINIQNNMISYQGLITNIVCEEAGLYELDNSIWFLLYNGMDDKGLRNGAAIQLDSCHLVDTQYWKGLLCCSSSKLSIILFSCNNDASYKPLYSQRNKLINFLFKVHPSATVWLLYAYLHLKHKLNNIASFSVILSIMNYLVDTLSFTDNTKIDPIASFLSYPHNCGYHQPESIYTLPSLCNIPLPDPPTHSTTDTSLVKWTYSITEYENVILVGHVTGNDNTGYLSLKDATGHVHFLFPNLTSENDCIVVIDKYKVVIELITVSHSMLCCHDYSLHYILPTHWKSCLPSCDVNHVTSDTSTYYFIIVNKTHLSSINLLLKFQLEVIVSTDLAQLSLFVHSNNDSNHSSVTQHVFEFTGKKWYPLLQYGNLYQLTATETNLLTKTFYTLTKEDKIELIEKDWFAVNELTLIDIYSNIQFWKDKIITFSGTIEDISFRIQNSHPCSENTSADISETLYLNDINKQLVQVIQLKNGLNSIMVYINMDDIPYPLGLLPNICIRCEKFILRLSRSGKPYASNCANSSIKLFNEVSITSQTYQVTYLSFFMKQILYGGQLLTHSVYVIQAYITSVQQISLQYRCSQCNEFFSNEHRETCITSEPLFTVMARVLIEDGSCEAHLYCESDMVLKQLLNITADQWANLKLLTQKVGQLFYTRYMFHNEKLKTEAGQSKELVQIINHNNIYRNIKATVHPFISKSEASNYRTVSKAIGHQVYTTIMHPRLQLKLLSIIQTSYRTECYSILDSLTKTNNN